MAGMAALKVKPSELKSKATEFKGKADKVKSTTKEMLNEIKSINGSTWSGDAANKFKNQFAKLDDDMERIYKMIVEYSKDLEEIAKQYEQAEKTNESVAEALQTDIF
ncbi:MAG: WXG100 family type VII secretion target [Bacteroidales bacterium]|nr:WXG100 family type VII secretion target [Clostridium sp.]MCM1203546.1 WXG100 family type VII secretion target [Bacteroidales bacterium]